MSLRSTPAAPRKSENAVQSIRWRRLRFAPLAIAAGAMGLGLASGLSRLGFPVVTGAIADYHGALMVSGFLGTLISLERAVAFGRWWGYAAPGLSAAAALLLIVEPRAATSMFVAAGVIMFAASIRIALRQLAVFSLTLAIAALCWTVGTVLWSEGYALPDIIPWWLDFMILTIAAERLELSRILHIRASSQIVFVFAVMLVLVGSARFEFVAPQAPFMAAGLIVLALWLLRHDVAMRTIRQSGVARFSAVAILAGHGWLAVAGIFLIAMPAGATLAYDAVVHTITIGVVLSMIFAHAPIILPAVVGLRVTIGRFAYVPLALLHLSLILRLGADATLHPELRVASAAATIVSIVGYAVALAVTSRLSQIRARPQKLNSI